MNFPAYAPRRAANSPSGLLPGGSIPLNNDPTVIGSTTYINPLTNGTGPGGTTAPPGRNGVPADDNDWFDSGFWDFWNNGGGGGDDDYIFGGGYGGGWGYGSGGSGGSSSNLTPLLTGLGGLALGSSLSRGNASAVQRNLPAEVAGLAGLAPGLAGSTVGTGLQLSPLVTAGNISNFGNALGQISPALRQGFDAANPGLAAQGPQLESLLADLNGRGPVRYDPTGYQASIAQNVGLGPTAQAGTERAGFTSAGPAAQGQFTPAQAYLAEMERARAERTAQQTARGGPLLSTLQNQAMQSVGGVSDLQARQQQIAMGLLGGSGGDLTGQDLRNVQQDTRGAFAARGLYDSNQAIGAEILNTDAARRQRLMQNLGIAQGVDAAGQQQIGATRNFALGVQNQGQNLSQFNAAQGNQVGMFNTGQANHINLANANNFNDLSKFNAGLQTQNSQFNSNLGSQVSLANASSQNQMAQFNSGQANNLASFNAQLGTQNNQWNAGAANQMNLAGAQLGQNNLHFNALQNNQASQYNSGLTTDAARFAAQAAGQDRNDQWGRAMGVGNFYQNQALNPTATAMGLIGNAPDYTGALLGYGSDLYNFNGNSQAAANNSRANNNAALTAAGLNLLYSVFNNNGRG